MTVQTGDNKWSTSDYIVDPVAGKGDFTTISDACAYFIANTITGKTCAIKSGTYTEDVSSVASGITYAAIGGSSYTPTVTIVGKVTFSEEGSVTFYGCRFETNEDYAVEVSGSSASVLTLDDCYINCTDNTGISYTSSSGNSSILLVFCTADIGTTGITLMEKTSPGPASFRRGRVNNTGNSTTRMDITAGTFGITQSQVFIPITASGTGSLNLYLSNINTTATNQTPFSQESSTLSILTQCQLQAGTAVGINIDNTRTITLVNAQVFSSNTNAISGDGTLIYGNITFTGTSSLINSTVTLSPLNSSIGGVSFDGGVNTLSDYEEGNFTPTVEGGTTPGVTTYSFQSGRYVRIGRMLFFDLNVNWTAATGTGVIKFGGLPNYTANISTVANIRSNIAISTATNVDAAITNATNVITVLGSVSSTGDILNSSLASNTNNFARISGNYVITP
jgi:hypothetical protein